MGGGPESQTNTWNFVQKISHFFEKIKCSKQPKKQNKFNFHFSLSGVPNVRGGWVGYDVWDKVPKKKFFFYTFPNVDFHYQRNSPCTDLYFIHLCHIYAEKEAIFTTKCVHT